MKAALQASELKFEQNEDINNEDIDKRRYS